MIQIDGSYGEGGGQILRTSLGLSLVTGKPFRIERIRAARKTPGLLRQHLTSVNAAAAIGQAETTGATLGSRELTFKPRQVLPGEYSFAIGTAGSTALVLQAVLPALILASGPSVLTLEGGTHNPFAPPFDFLQRAFLPLLKRMGVNIRAELDRYGFYPAGGGKVRFIVTPTSQLKPFELLQRGPIVAWTGTALVANLSTTIAERELAMIGRKLAWPADSLRLESVSNSTGPGNFVSIEIASEHVTEVFTAFGERGLPAETVASSAVKAARGYLASDMPVGEYLADQLLIPMALARGGSFATCGLSRHSRTNIEIIHKFLDVRISIAEQSKRTCVVEIRSDQ